MMMGDLCFKKIPPPYLYSGNSVCGLDINVNSFAGKCLDFDLHCVILQKKNRSVSDLCPTCRAAIHL